MADKYFIINYINRNWRDSYIAIDNCKDGQYKEIWIFLAQPTVELAVSTILTAYQLLVRVKNIKSFV